MRHRILAGAVVLVAAALLSGGCATTRYSQSHVVAPSPATPRQARAAASFALDGLAVRVETLDRATRDDPIPDLALRVTLRPDALGYSFDPGQVVLRTADGREWRAAGGQYQPVLRGASFEVAFDAPVAPGESAELTLGGIARGRKRLEPVALRLARREGVSRALTRTGEQILTVPLVILLAPLALAGAATGGGY